MSRMAHWAVAAAGEILELLQTLPAEPDPRASIDWRPLLGAMLKHVHLGSELPAELERFKAGTGLLLVLLDDAIRLRQEFLIAQELLISKHGGWGVGEAQLGTAAQAHGLSLGNTSDAARQFRMGHPYEAAFNILTFALEQVAICRRLALYPFPDLPNVEQREYGEWIARWFDHHPTPPATLQEDTYQQLSGSIQRFKPIVAHLAAEAQRLPQRQRDPAIRELLSAQVTTPCGRRIHCSISESALYCLRKQHAPEARGTRVPHADLEAVVNAVVHNNRATTKTRLWATGIAHLHGLALSGHPVKLKDVIDAHNALLRMRSRRTSRTPA